jgi:hypothetical protein
MKKKALKIGKPEIIPDKTIAEIVKAIEPTDLEKIEAELGEISLTLKGLKQNDPAKYREVYKRYMWLIAERETLKNG